MDTSCPIPRLAAAVQTSAYIREAVEEIDPASHCEVKQSLYSLRTLYGGLCRANRDMSVKTSGSVLTQVKL